jgi:hypothetical protein
MHVVQHVDRVAIAPLSPSPQVTAMRAAAMEGACGPWSTAATSACSRSRACASEGMSPRVISQIICGKVSRPISSSIGWPRRRIWPGAMSMIAVDHQSETSLAPPLISRPPA